MGRSLGPDTFDQHPLLLRFFGKDNDGKFSIQVHGEGQDFWVLKHIGLAEPMVIMDAEFHPAIMTGKAKLVRSGDQIILAEWALLIERIQ